VPTASPASGKWTHAKGISVEVEVPDTHDERQARMKVGLYLRAWEALHPGSRAKLLDA
jgi:hypothetical protein